MWQTPQVEAALAVLRADVDVNLVVAQETLMFVERKSIVMHGLVQLFPDTSG